MILDRRRACSVIVAALVAIGSTIAAQGTTAAASGACPGSTGVTIVVDYQALGGGVVVACAPGSPSTGFVALKAAGFDIQEVQNVPGFLCRIEGRPGTDREDCQGTPPASAYWSYWRADRGGTWSVNQEGGKTRTPPPGSVDGWSFSDDGSPGGAAPPPGVAPPAPSTTPKPTPKPTPRPTPVTTPKPTPRPTATTPAPAPATEVPIGTAGPTTQPASLPTISPTSSIEVGSPESTLVPSPTTADPPDGSPSPVVVAVDAGNGSPSDTSGGGPPLGTAIGIGLIVLLGAGAIMARWRRPSIGPGDG